MAITYDWRGGFDNAELNALHAEAFNHRVTEDDWRRQVHEHSLGWVCATDGDELVGFVNVAWDGAVTPSSWTRWWRGGSRDRELEPSS